MNQESDRETELFTPAEAVEYLRNKRGLIYTTSGLRSIRFYKRASTHRVLRSGGLSISLWTKAELDAIQPTKRTKRVKPEEEDDQGKGTSVRLMLSAPLQRRSSFRQGKKSRTSRTRATLRREHQRVGV